MNNVIIKNDVELYGFGEDLLNYLKDKIVGFIEKEDFDFLSYNVDFEELISAMQELRDNERKFYKVVFGLDHNYITLKEMKYD